MRQSHMVLGLFGSPNSLKSFRLINQSLLVERWSTNGIREKYNHWLKAQAIDPPPKSISFNKVQVQRRSKPN